MLVVALAGLNRRDGAVLVGVVAEPHRKAGDEPPPGDAIEQRVLLGDLQRLSRFAQRASEDGEGHIKAFGLRGVGHRGRHQVGVRRDVIRRLTVLCHAHPVKAGSGRMQQLRVSGLERFLHPPRLHQIKVRRGHHRAVAILEASGQVPIWHLLEHTDLHPRPPRPPVGARVCRLYPRRPGRACTSAREVISMSDPLHGWRGSPSVDNRADGDRGDDQDAADNVLPVVRNREQVEAVRDHAQDQHTEDGAPD